MRLLLILLLLIACGRLQKTTTEPYVVLLEKENGQTFIYDTINAETDVKAILKAAVIYTNLRRQEIKFGEMYSKGFVVKNFEGVDLMKQEPEDFRRMVDSMVYVNIHMK